MAKPFQSLKAALKKAQTATALELYGDELFMPDLEIGPEIGQLSNLKSLSISGYHEVMLPETMEKLQNLEKLYLSCSLNFIPHFVFQLPKLKELRLELSNYDWEPEMRQLKNLELLELSSINTLGKELGFLKKLKKLVINSDKLRSLPEEIDQLKSLQDLDISYSGFQSLPKAVCRLDQLKRLNISQTFIEELPLEIKNLQNLEELLFTKPFEHHGKEQSKTRIKQIRAAWGDLSQLKKLDLSRQQVLDVSAQVRQLNKLQELNLSYNDLEKIPAELLTIPHLKKLNLDHNQIAELPQDIGNWSQLEELSLINNPLRNPEALAELSQLKKLDLRRIDIGPEQLKALKEALASCEIVTSKD